jgi:NADPH-dependent ferric siderophore reductase
MPELPVFLAQRMEQWMGVLSTVSSIETMTPRFRLVRFEGQALCQRSWVAGQEVEIRVGEREFRHYTPVSYHQERGVMEILFYLHGKGPGSTWVQTLTCGQKVFVLGPANGAPFIPLPQRTSLLVGDESVLGTVLALRHAQPELFEAVIEVEASDHADLSTLFPALTLLPRADGVAGTSLDLWFQEHDPSQNYERVYLLGHAQSIQRLRTLLFKRYHWERRRLKTKPYWADGKHGL